jgi:hypothetical protein
MQKAINLTEKNQKDLEAIRVKYGLKTDAEAIRLSLSIMAASPVAELIPKTSQPINNVVKEDIAISNVVKLDKAIKDKDIELCKHGFKKGLCKQGCK